MRWINCKSHYLSLSGDLGDEANLIFILFFLQSAYAVENSVENKLSRLKEFLDLYRLTINNFSTFHFVLEILKFFLICEGRHTHTAYWNISHNFTIYHMKSLEDFHVWCMSWDTTTYMHSFKWFRYIISKIYIQAFSIHFSKYFKSHYAVWCHSSLYEMKK